MIKSNSMKQKILLILIAVISFWAVNNFGVIWNIIVKFFNVLLPFILGCVLAFILNIPMMKIEGWLKKGFKNIKSSVIRVISIVLTLGISFVVVSAILFLLIPELIDSIQSLISSLPGVIDKLEVWVLDLLDKYPDIQKKISELFTNNSQDIAIGEILNYIVNFSVGLVGGVVSGIVTVFTAIVFVVYILSQKEYLIKGIKKLVYVFVKKDYADKMVGFVRLANHTFSNFISGQCVEAVILGSIFFVVLSLFRFPYALIISVLTTVTALIPIFGAFIAMVVGALLIAINSPMQALIFIIIFQVIQQIEGNFIYPRVVGKSVGLSPMWTLFAISVGGSLFGIVGMLVSLPLASIVYALLRDNVNNRINRLK